MDRDILLRAYAAIGDLTPMAFDCGGLCGAACCRKDADGQGGVHLFPGEAEMLEACDWVEQIAPGSFAPIMSCFWLRRNMRAGEIGVSAFSLTDPLPASPFAGGGAYRVRN